jgi:cellulose biosynthesis protein BcsQ
MKTVAFFNNKGGVGKTCLAYHLAWTFADHGISVIAADLDPQSNLTSVFLSEKRLENIWGANDHRHSLMWSLGPILEEVGDIKPPWIEKINERISLIVGNLSLSSFEDKLSTQWPLCLDRDPAAFRVTSAFYRILEAAANQMNGTDIVLMDVGPNLGAINRSALISVDHVVIPLIPDLFFLHGLRNLGPTLRNWREGWKERLERYTELDLSLPRGLLSPEGYVVMQYSVRLDRPVRAYEHWMKQIPIEYRYAVLNETVNTLLTVDNDPHCLAQIKNYRSLMPMAMEAKKPMFHLRPADGAIGSHQQAALQCRDDFTALARQIGQRIGLRKF